MASTAKVLSSLSSSSSPSSSTPRAVSAPAPRRARWGWLELVRDALGGALLVGVWIVLWTVTWAAVAGPLSPAPRGGAAVASKAAGAGSAAGAPGSWVGAPPRSARLP